MSSKKELDENFDFDTEFNVEDLPMFDFHEPTPEELEQAKKERAIELEKKGFLPENEGFNSIMGCSQEEVERNPRKYIIEECLPACQELWEKNIYTFMVSDHLNEGVCWIEVDLDSLSDENKDIYMCLSEEEAIKFSYHRGCVNFGVSCVGREGQLKLLELAKKFQMQDVQKGLAYISPQDFLMNYCGCYEEIKNPNYKYMTPPWEQGLELEQLGEYMEQYENWQNSSESKETFRRFDSSKVIKSIPEYAQEHGMIVDDDRIYLSEFHYKKHQNFVEYERSLESQSIGNGPKR